MTDKKGEGGKNGLMTILGNRQEGIDLSFLVA